jgi:hypothetical protein
MPIEIDPIIIPSKTLNQIWIHHLSVGTTSVNGDALLNASLIPYNNAGDQGSVIPLDTINVFAEVAADEDAALIFSLFQAYLIKKAREQGKIP